jgi:hypothetical protein
LSPDLKRAEDWKREKAMVVGGDEEEGKEGKRSSLFFDAEGKEEGKASGDKAEGLGKI